MDTVLQKMISDRAEKATRPDGSPYLRLLHIDETDIAQSLSITQKQVQLCALQNDILPERYCRNQNSISFSQQLHLLQSHVAIIGQGGLGGTVTEILSRIGVGQLTLVDGDTFEESNLNRQLLSTVEYLGSNKADVGMSRVTAINPAVEVSAINDFLTEKNAADIIQGVDVVVDCLDSISARFIVENACRSAKVPLVSAAIGGSAGQALVIFPGDEGLKVIYGNQHGVETKGIEKQQGTLPYAAVLMAAVESAQVVSLLCSKPPSLRNALLLAEIDEAIFEKIVTSG